MSGIALYLFNLIGKWVGSKVIASLTLGTIGPSLMHVLINTLAPNVTKVLPQNVIDMIVVKSFSNLVMMVVPSPTMMLEMTKFSFKSIYLVFKGAKFVIVKVLDLELIEKIINFIIKSSRPQEPIMNIISNQPLTNHVIDEDYNGINRKYVIDSYTTLDTNKTKLIDKDYNKIVDIKKFDNDTQKVEYISNVIKTRNEIDVINEPKVFEVSQEEVQILLKDMEFETIELGEGKNMIVDLNKSESQDEKYPELLDLLSDSITASWTDVPFDENNYNINNVPKNPISIEDSWVNVYPSAPLITDS